jgi:hypothetical protein
MFLSYGEVGIRVMHETFNRLVEISPEAAMPLTQLQFVALVLTLEAGVQLIMEDLAVSRDDAIQEMHASSSYGAHMFPDTDN